MKIAKIISGGQNGADRAALDAAIELGIPHGGFCPAGRRCEAGKIPAKYQLKETASDGYLPRTRKNVMSADATVIFSHGKLEGGSRETMKFAVAGNKKWIHVDLLDPVDWVAQLNEWFGADEIVVNVAGPRSSKDRRIYKAVLAQLMSELGE